MLHWPSFSEWETERVACSFADKGYQCVGYTLQQAYRFPITVLTLPKSIDTLLTISLRW